MLIRVGNLSVFIGRTGRRVGLCGGKPRWSHGWVDEPGVFHLGPWEVVIERVR